jgi:hypothetical protein
MNPRRCTATTIDGRPCGATPMRDGPCCFWHSPETADEAAEARYLGGLRRRREKAVVGAYELGGLDSTEGLRRILEIVMVDTLALENSGQRSRALIAAERAALDLLKTRELAGRVAALEAAVATIRSSNAAGLLEVVPDDVPPKEEVS